MYTYMYIYICVCVRYGPCMYVCAFMVHGCMYVLLYMSTTGHTQAHVCVTCMYVYVCVCMYVSM